jgi:hypothetical protein
MKVDNRTEVSMFNRLLLGVLVLSAPLCAPTRGQATQPVSASWIETAAALVDALIDPSADASAVGRLIPDSAIIQRFGSREQESPFRLQQQVQGMSLIAVRGYTWPAPTIASDMASDIKQAQSLPPVVQKLFEIKDDADGRRANTTAAQWVSGVLGPNTGELVAVAVLWPPQPAVASSDDAAVPDAREPFFVLIKGHAVEGSFRIAQITYGDARSALK